MARRHIELGIWRTMKYLNGIKKGGIMFCPNCGKEIDDKLIKYKKGNKYLPSGANLKCPYCLIKIELVNRRFMDQEGIIDIIYH